MIFETVANQYLHQLETGSNPCRLNSQRVPVGDSCPSNTAVRQYRTARTRGTE